jgi:hypothetical protein
MSRLFMGEIDKKPSRTFGIEVSGMKHHLFITGQSGCGKSSLAARLVEEIILRGAGHVLLFDCNFEFSRFTEVDVNAFKATHNRKNCPEDDVDKFTKAWNAKRSSIVAIKATEINIPYCDIETNLKPALLGIDRDNQPGAYWLLQLIDEAPALKDRIVSKEGLMKSLPDIGRWFEGRATRGEEKELGSIIYDIRRNMSALDLTRFTNAGKSLGNQKYVNFETPEGSKTIDKGLVEKLFESTCFCSIDLLNFEYKHYNFRDFVVLHLLHCIWKEAKNRFIERKTKGGADTAPLFIVIDEAHNLAPSGTYSTQSPTAREVASIIRTIAAEGRKFGIFLILVSQRPEKIDENVLSECDNFIVMKSTPPAVERLIASMALDEGDTTKIKGVASFTVGQAFYYGEFTDRKLLKAEADIRRTR